MSQKGNEKPVAKPEARESMETTGKALDLELSKAGEAIEAEQGRYVFDLGDHCTDMGNARRFFTVYGDKIKYSAKRKVWYLFTGKRWELYDDPFIAFLAKGIVTDIYKEAADCQDDERRQELVKWGLKSESARAIAAILELYRSERNVAIDLSILDTNNSLLNCTNGTFGLESGKLLEHDRDDFITRMLDIEYAPEAECPLWMKFLDQVTCCDKELQAYLQRAVGYSLTGDTREQCFFFLYGLGNNGKSTFVDTIRFMLGQYAQKASTDTFMSDKFGGAIKEGIANLNGKRFITATEISAGKDFNTALLKDLTGGETISTRRLYEHEVEFRPTGKIWLSGNHKPVIKDSTVSIWRRVKLVPFTAKIADKDIDKKLGEKLKTELAGILAWAVRGCLEWQVNGLQEPLVVIGATALYRKDSDILAEFLDDCCLLNDRSSCSKKELRAVYEKWAEENKQDTIKTTTFKACLAEKGIMDVRDTKGNRAWMGIGLKGDN